MRIFGSERANQEGWERRFRLRSGATWLGGLLVVGLILVGVGSVAAQTTSGVINGCYDQKTFLIRYLNSGSCTNKETPISWNKEGPQGPQGEQGPQGPQGEQGPSGVSGYEIVESAWQIPPDERYRINAECPSGKRVLGGGAQGEPGNPIAMDITESFPLPSGGQGDLWVATVRNNTSTTQTAIAHVICAEVDLP